jgi:Holliday junction DNA helicase RuvA
MSPIDYIVGRVVERGVEWVVIEAGGFGWRLNVAASTAAGLAVEMEARLLCHLYVREDTRALYAFAEPAERSLFLQLLSVSGVGPATSLAALSLLGAGRLAAAIEAGDVATLSRVPRLGKRTAERIVLDLKGKVAVPAVAVGTHEDAVLLDGLMGMGLTRTEAAEALAAVPPDAGRSIDETLLLALRARGLRGAGA